MNKILFFILVSRSRLVRPGSSTSWRSDDESASRTLHSTPPSSSGSTSKSFIFNLKTKYFQFLFGKNAYLKYYFSNQRTQPNQNNFHKLQKLKFSSPNECQLYLKSSGLILFVIEIFGHILASGSSLDDGQLRSEQKSRLQHDATSAASTTAAASSYDPPSTTTTAFITR